MIRLKSIHIIGFKDPSEEKYLEFSSEPITVIYGQNGSGKTTLLKILFAVLSRDEKTLLQENVMEVNLVYEKDGDVKELVIIQDIENGIIYWTDNFDIYNTSSILFGVHRGVVSDDLYPILKNDKPTNTRIMSQAQLFSFAQSIHPYAQMESMTSKTKLEKIIMELKKPNAPIKKYIEELVSMLATLEESTRITVSSSAYHFVKSKQKELLLYKNSDNVSTNDESNFLKKLDNQPHLSTDFVSIKDIQSAIVNQYNKGQKILSDKIQKAFFETIEKAVEIDETKEEFDLPDNFYERIKANKDFILNAIPKENSSLTERIKKYLDTGDKSLTKSKIFRAMLLNVIESAEDENPTLESISKLIEIFNEHLYNHKKLVVDGENAYIQLKNGKIHALSELSSGERNILSILTLFLIIGSERDFLMIDEPEISLNIKWQRKFLPLLSKINSKAQIIVASHSPSIAHQNSKYLVELL